MPDPRHISEKVFQSTVRKAALLNGWRFYHTYNSMRSDEGFCDCVMVKGKRLIFAELKSDKGKLTPKQAEWIAALAEAGQLCFVWRPVDMDDIWEILRK